MYEFTNAMSKRPRKSILLSVRIGSSKHVEYWATLGVGTLHANTKQI
jgi:hypothetical protein